jgi:succinate dehydrogenase/fumarate reductase-like Fe-S protein
MPKRTFQIYRYDPDKDAKPFMQTVEVELDGNERMLLDALMKLKAVRTRRCPSAAPAARACAARTR